MKRKTTYSIFSKAAAIFLAVALLWLTISAPFSAIVQKAKQQCEWNGGTDDFPSEDENDSKGADSEEKAPDTKPMSEDFIHNTNGQAFLSDINTSKHITKHADTFVAYHGKLETPPPDCI